MTMTIAGKSPFLIGDTSSNAWFSIVMLVLGGILPEINLPSGKLT